MKKLINTGLLVLGLGGPMLGQTNTFPDSGNVGIGTTPQWTKVDINQSTAGLWALKVRNSGTGAASALLNGFADSTDANSCLIDIASAAGAQFYMKGNGNIGIGTWGPQSPLEIASAVSANATALRFSTAGSPTYGFDFSLDGVTSGDLGLRRIEAGVATEMIHFQRGTGNVGIGTTAPRNRLEVNAGSDTSQILWGLNIRNEGNAGTSGYGSGLKLKISSDGGLEDNKWAGMASVAQTGYGNAVGLAFYVNPTANSSPVEKVRIDQNGNLGIGTATPQAPLTVSGDILLAGTPTVGSYGMLKAVYNGSSELHGTAASIDFYRPVSQWGNEGEIRFSTHPGATGVQTPIQRMVIDRNGNVGIGTPNPGAYKLAVLGKIRAQEVIVDTGWSDYVFAPDYQLPALSAVEAHIKAEKHLPGIPSASEVAAHGISLGEMQAKLLAKIEELTLHQIDQEKRMEILAAENAKLRSRMAELEHR